MTALQDVKLRKQQKSLTKLFPFLTVSLKISQRQFMARCFSEENSSVEDNELLGGIRDKVVKFTYGNTLYFAMPII
jgi:hypothetical protein